MQPVKLNEFAEALEQAFTIEFPEWPASRISAKDRRSNGQPQQKGRV